MDKPVCSNRMSLLSFVKSKEGDVWTIAETAVVEIKLREIVDQMEAVKKAAQEALQLHGER